MVRKRKRLQKGSKKWTGAAWVIRYRIRSADGWTERKEILPDLEADDEDEAERLLKKRMKRVNEENDPAGPGARRRPDRIDFLTFVDSHWLPHMEERQRKISTLHTYKCMLNSAVLPAIGDRHLKEISALDIKEIISGVLVAGNSLRYALHVYQLVHGIFALAVDLEFIKKSPVKPKIHRPEVPKLKRPTFTREQIRNVMEAFPGEFRILCGCIAVTGMRIGELTALRWCDVDLGARTITVAHNLWRRHLLKPKTEDSNRIFRISQRLAVALEEHRSESRWTGRDDYVFAQADGSPSSADILRRKVLYPAMEAAGIKRIKGQAFHLLFRHSAASILQTEVKDLKVTQEFLGHSNISTTADVYVHLEDEIIEEAAQTLDDALWPDTAPVFAEGSDRIQ